MINDTIATTAFNQSGLDAMGSASGQLAAHWAEGAPSYDSDAMTLSLEAGSRWHAMVGGVLKWHAFGANGLTDVTGAPLTGAVAVLSFHPQAALRIQRLVGARFDGRTDGSTIRPVPFYAAFRGGIVPDELAGMNETDPPLAPIDAPVGEPIVHGTLTFHDERGLIIDPVAVACLFCDLMRGFPALLSPRAGNPIDLTSSGLPGGIGNITTMGSGRRLHIVNMFGAPWSDRSGVAGLRLGSGTRLGSGPHDWPGGQTLNATATSPGELRYGFHPEGMLSTSPLLPPNLPTTAVPAGSSLPRLEREFFRVVAVDLGLHLKGNRTADPIEEVLGADEATVLEPSPSVRDGDTIDFLNDGEVVLGAISEIAVLPGLRLAASPVIDINVAFPANRADRWPTSPTMTQTPEALDGEHSRRARSDVTGSYVGEGPDILLRWPAGSLPAEAYVRVFPRVDPGPAIVPLDELDFSLRGDGASGIAKTEGLTLLLKDPYRVGTAAAPASPTLRFDLLIVTRAGIVRGRLFGGIEININSGATAPAETPASNLLSALPATQRGISPSPLLGLPPTASATGSDPVLAAFGLSNPRESPRFRTMARTETVVAGHDGSAPGVWHAVLTAGFLNARSVRGNARLGNPGNPAGTEESCPGLLATGQLGLDLARSALRRTHHLANRLRELDNSRWSVPPSGAGTIAGTVLQNVAQTVENPDLDLLPESFVHELPGNWNDLIAALQPLLPSSLSSLTGAIPAPGAGDRWVEEVRREAFAAKHGRRDTQWGWSWAISHARRLIYLESPLFCSTAATTDDHEVDLVGLLRTQLTARKDLRVIISTPKRIPFGPGYESFAQRFHIARNQAIAALRSVAPKRVVVYHPIGFPGRPEIIRGTVGVVDDVWALLGSSSFSKRGLTFDGSADVVLVDKLIRRGVSDAVRRLRRDRMARTLGLAPPTLGETANANWVRLTQETSAFELIREIVERGGDGMVEPLWSGLPENELPAVDRSIADPEGRGFNAVLATFVELLAGLGQDRV